MSGSELKSRILSPESLVPASMLAVVAVAAWTSAMMLAGIRADLAYVKKAVGPDAWNFAMQKDYASALQIIHPGFGVPDVQRIHDQNLPTQN